MAKGQPTELVSRPVDWSIELRLPDADQPHNTHYLTISGDTSTSKVHVRVRTSNGAQLEFRAEAHELLKGIDASIAIGRAVRR